MGIAPERTALVTGASRGIGRALTQSLVADGWRVVALARDRGLLGELRDELGPAIIPYVADVTDPKAMAGLGDRLAEVGPGRLDLAVANAGAYTAVGPTWTADPEAWWHDLAVNVRGVQLTLRAVLPGMVAGGHGRVVVLSSGMSTHPTPWSSAYGASKAALNHLVGSVAGELAGTGVGIFAISPGMVATEMTQWPEELLAFRPDLRDLAPSAFLPTTRASDLVRELASGRLDALTGRFIHVRDDLDALLAAAADAT